MKDHNPLSILMVEDDKAALEILASMLTLKYPQITFFFNDNGKSGLECFRQHQPSIVITDINMPGMDGIRMAVEIKSINADVRLIVITAFSFNTIQESARTAGIEIDHYISKPVDYVKLFEVIERCIVS